MNGEESPQDGVVEGGVGGWMAFVPYYPRGCFVVLLFAYPIVGEGENAIANVGGSLPVTVADGFVEGCDVYIVVYRE